MNTIVHIAPQLPPAIDGVGDYCWHVWKHWPDVDTQFRFLVLHGAEKTRAVESSVQVDEFRPGTLHEVLEAAGARTVVLHYVGYGFQPKGVPLWLPPALERWRSEGSARRLVTMFHEMYATSSPLRSPFWVKPWAQQIIRRLVHASDAWVTSCERYFEWLVNEFHADAKRGTLLPIAPNVPASPEACQERLWPLQFGRKLRVAIFGLPNTRLMALERHHGFLAALVRTQLIETIQLIGKSDVSARHIKRLLPLQQRIGGAWLSEFDLPSDQVADALAACDIGFVANDASTLTKSGVFAAMASNGVVCIASNQDGSALRPPFNECVMLNNDNPRGFDALMAELRGVNRMVARRRMTLQVARSELAWPRVAAVWRGVLDQARQEAQPIMSRASSPSPMPNRQPSQEVRA
jgi:hypothetical protein